MPCLLLAADTLTACLLTALHWGYEQCILMPDKPSTCPIGNGSLTFFGWPPPTFLHMDPGGGISLATKPLQRQKSRFLPFPLLQLWLLRWQWGCSSLPARLDSCSARKDLSNPPGSNLLPGQGPYSRLLLPLDGVEGVCKHLCALFLFTRAGAEFLILLHQCDPAVPSAPTCSGGIHFVT